MSTIAAVHADWVRRVHTQPEAALEEAEGLFVEAARHSVGAAELCHRVWSWATRNGMDASEAAQAIGIRLDFVCDSAIMQARAKLGVPNSLPLRHAWASCSAETNRILLAPISDTERLRLARRIWVDARAQLRLALAIRQAVIRHYPGDPEDVAAALHTTPGRVRLANRACHAGADH